MYSTRTFARVLGLVFGLLIPSAHLSAAEFSQEPVSEEEIAALIDQLGDVSYVRREAAEKHLLKVGFFAISHINRAAHRHPNVEIRERAKRLTILIPLVAIELFKSGGEGSEHLSLPGWERFRQLAGEDKISRSFFFEMYRHQSALLLAYEADPEEAKELLELRCRRLDDFDDTKWSVGALLLMAADGQIEISQRAQLHLCKMLEQICVGNSSRDVFYQPLYKLLTHWMAQDHTDEVLFAQLQLAIRGDLHANWDRISAVIADRDFPAEYRAALITSIANFNDPAVIKSLRPLLNDRTPYGETSQICDVALAAMVYLSDQDLKNYGFANSESRVAHFEFSELKGRERALANWHAWEQRGLGLAEKVKAFLAEVDDPENVSLPGWDRFRQIAGNAPAVRALFAEMYLQESEMLDAYGNSSDDIGQMFQQYCARMRMRNKRIAGLATLLLIAGDDRVESSVRSTTQIISLFQGEAVNRALAKANPEYKPHLQKIFGTWIVRSDASKISQLNKLNLAMRYEVPEGIEIAVGMFDRLMEEGPKSQTQASQYILILQALAKLGDKTHIPLIEPLLENNTVLVAADRGQLDIQLRDVALAAIIHLAGQKWSGYALRDIGPDEVCLFNWSTVRFNSKEDRELAIQKWQAWSKQNAQVK